MVILTIAMLNYQRAIENIDFNYQSYKLQYYGDFQFTYHMFNYVQLHH